MSLIYISIEKINHQFYKISEMNRYLALLKWAQVARVQRTQLTLQKNKG